MANEEQEFPQAPGDIPFVEDQTKDVNESGE